MDRFIDILKSIASIPLLLVITIFASLAWFFEHLHNLITGHGWIGMRF